MLMIIPAKSPVNVSVCIIITTKTTKSSKGGWLPSELLIILNVVQSMRIDHRGSRAINRPFRGN